MSGEVELPICRLPHGMDLALPAYDSAGSAGLDLRSEEHTSEPQSQA